MLNSRRQLLNSAKRAAQDGPSSRQAAAKSNGIGNLLAMSQQNRPKMAIWPSAETPIQSFFHSPQKRRLRMTPQAGPSSPFHPFSPQKKTRTTENRPCVCFSSGTFLINRCGGCLFSFSSQGKGDNGSNGSYK